MTAKMLVIDIGNSRTALTVVGLDGQIAPRGVRRMPTREASVESVCENLGRLCRSRKIDVALAASVVPAANRVWRRAIGRQCGIPLDFVRHDHRWNFSLRRYRHPETIGADRLVNLYAARRRYCPPLLVVDFGTALTIDAIDRRDEFIGGVIAPGFEMVAGALGRGTALLPAFPMRVGKPARAVGLNTREAMRIGVLGGYRGLAETLVGQVARSLGARVTICVTGGYGAAMAALLPDLHCRVHPHLTLEGMAAVARSVFEQPDK